MCNGCAFLVGGWTNPFEKMLVTLDHFPKVQGENTKKHLKPPTSIQLLTQSTKKASRISKNTSGRCRFMAMLGLAGHNLGLARIPVMSWSLDSWEMGVFHKVTATSGPKKTQKSLALKKIQTWMLIDTSESEQNHLFVQFTPSVPEKKHHTPSKTTTVLLIVAAYKSEFSLKQIAA